MNSVWKAVHRARVWRGKAAAEFGRDNIQWSKTWHYLIWNMVSMRSHILLQQRCLQQNNFEVRLNWSKDSNGKM